MDLSKLIPVNCVTEGLQHPLVSWQNLFIESFLFVNVPALEGLLQNPGGYHHPSSTIYPSQDPSMSLPAPAARLPELTRSFVEWNSADTGDETKWANGYQLLSSWWLLIAYQHSHHQFSKSPLWSVLESLPSTLNFSSFSPQFSFHFLLWILGLQFSCSSPALTKRVELWVQLLKDLWPNIHIHLCDKTSKYPAR